MAAVGVVSTRLASTPRERIGSMHCSSPVECFRSKADQDRIRAGTTIPTTAAASAAYQRRTVELARRCGQVGGDLLDRSDTIG